jgi:hypothetical protein
LSDENQKNILNASTHFNPVDLVCSIKNYKNEKFDLAQFVDHNSGFIVENNIRKNSKIIQNYRAYGMELANWITIFVK